MKTKKELKQAYKFYKSPKGVFQIQNKINGKKFIGSSMDLIAIWNRYQLQLNFGNHPNKELQKEWKEFGASAFEYKIIEELEEQDDKKINYEEEIKILEGFYIEEFRSFDEKGYNKKPI